MTTKGSRRALNEQRHRDWTVARQRLCLSALGCTHRMVCEAVATAVRVPMPETKNARYALVRRFVGGHVPASTIHTTPTDIDINRDAPIWHRSMPASAKPIGIDVNSREFLESYEWRKLRMVVLKKRGTRCECCGATPRDGVRMHVDHIKSRRRHPELALTEANLQVLCEVCNHGKGAWDETDWRADSQLSRESSADSPVTRSGDGDEQIDSAKLPGARPISQGRVPKPRLVTKTG